MKFENTTTSHSLQIKDNEYSLLLSYANHKYEHEYQKHKENNISHPLFIELFSIIEIMLLISRIISCTNSLRRGVSLNIIFINATIIDICLLTIFIIVIMERNIYTILGIKLTSNNLNSITNIIILLENVLAVGSSLTSSMTIVGKSLVGSCIRSDGVPFLSPFGCNPLAISHAPPLLAINYLLITPLCFNILFRYTKKSVCFMSWLIAMIVTIWSCVYTKYPLRETVYLFIYGIVIFLVMYALEEKHMSNFLKTKRILHLEKEKRELLLKDHAEREKLLEELNELKLNEMKRQFQMDLQDVNTKNEATLRAAETLQLRTLLGNVAHDMKTPIQSMLTDIELLKTSIPDVQEYMSSLDKADCMKVCDSLLASCTFMTVSINRCLDYTKCECGIALNPTMVTFELSSTIITASGFIKSHLQEQDQNRIVLHPISSDICPYLISDKHWFSENLMCYISNAEKYSRANSIIDVRIELITEDTAAMNNDNSNQISTSISSESLKICHATSIPAEIQNVEISVTKEETISTNDTNTEENDTNLVKDQTDHSNFSYESVLVSPTTQSLSSISPTTSSTKSKFISTSSSNVPIQNNSSTPLLQIDATENTTTSSMENQDQLEVCIRDLNISSKKSNSSKLSQMIRVTVADRGTGLSDEDRKNLFRPFKQAQRMTGGTGLGLYSLSKRVEALEGHYGVEARSDHLDGSVFWFSFPYTPDPTGGVDIDKIDTITHGEVSSKFIGDIPCLRILLVDDSRCILKSLERNLTQQGHIVEMRNEGQAGLDRMKETYLLDQYDVLVTDLQMPVMDGFKFISQFRKFEEEMLMDDNIDKCFLKRQCYNKNGKFLIIGMSANSDAQSKKDALDAGMDDFLTKPFAYKVFLKTIEQYFV